MSAPPPTKPEVSEPKVAKPRKRLRYMLAGLLVLALAAVMTPSVFHFTVLRATVFFAARRDVVVSIEKVGGSIFEPVIFYGVKASAVTSSRTSANIEIARLDVDYSLPALVFKAGVGSVRAVTIDGLDGKFNFPANDAASDSTTASGSVRKLWPNRLLPSKIDALHANLTFRQGDSFVRLQNLDCLASDTEPGIVQIEKIAVKQPWLAKTFPSVKGAAALQNSRISLANVALGSGVKFTSLSSDLSELSRGRLKVEFDIAAFSGTVRGEINGAAGRMHSQMEVNGSFAQISVPELAGFFEFDGEAGGIIREGKFSFNGSLRNLQKATFSIRLEAADFRLGKRQWNSLVGGATLVEHHIQIPELRLKQAHNELNLKGEMTLPTKRIEWWQSEFAFDIAAKIDNLTELSALVGPEFADAAGKVTIDGSVKGANQSFDGELAVAGSGLSYRGAPVEKLRASVKLSGNELQISGLEFSNKNDFVRGRGVVNILGREKRYWGELKASVADLTLYSALLQKPIVPQAPAGGLTVDWSGDGVANAHSGAFSAQFKKFRLVSVTEPKAHPINADLVATYSPGNIFFSKFVVWDNDTNFSARITAAPKTLNLQSVRIEHEDAVWLEGDALLPFNIWSTWENASWATLLEFDSPCKVSLAAKNLDLRAVALLSGRQLPVKGELQMNLTTDGTLNDISADGKIILKKSQVTLGDDGADVVGADGEMSFNEQDLKIEKSQVKYNTREFDTEGKINFKNLRDPDFDIAVHTKKVAITLRSDAVIDTDLDLNVAGTWGEAVVSGTAQVLDFRLAGNLDATQLVAGVYDLKLDPILPLDASHAPFNNWRFEVALATQQPAEIMWWREGKIPPPEETKGYSSSGTLTANLTLRGKGQATKLSGAVDFQKVAVTTSNPDFAGGWGSPRFGEIVTGKLVYPADDSAAWFAYAMTGAAEKTKLTGWIFGSESGRSSIFFSDPPLSQDEIISFITGARKPEPPLDILTEDFLLELKNFSAPAVLRTK